jgi:hypothetical protein
MPNFIKLTESQLSIVIKTLINENELSIKPQNYTIQDVTLNNFYKKVKTLTKGKKLF